ncbi:MAG TPA: serine/threonine-protein kinase, partial [Rugosimonospora sp.]|nr:serine/threonine-protein kinase [Rugosimonospora sp.]
MDGKSGGEVEAAELAGLPHRVPARPLRPHDPRKVGDYQLIGRLGEGGMGRVYLARSGAGRLVAVKVIRDALAEDSDFLRRFRGEVARARQVPPFCTAEVLDADPDHDPPYLVVEFVDGPTLADVVERDGPLTPANLHGLAVGMAAALTAIHGAGVIHRDLKPSNVLLAPGTPKVIDFGISRPVDGTMTNSTGNFVLGTVSYMSPERFGADASRTLSPAADIFAWGAVVTFAGTGKVPFPADSLAEIAMRIMTDPPELDGLTGTLRDLVERALAKEPAQRPTARELLEQLTTAV